MTGPINSSIGSQTIPKLPDGPCLANGLRMFTAPLKRAPNVCAEKPLVIAAKVEGILSPQEYGEECPITLITYKELAENKDLAVTRCGHKFSRTEATKWLASHESCPNPHCSETVKVNDLTGIVLKTEVQAKEVLTPPPPPPPVVPTQQFLPIINGVPTHISIAEALKNKKPGESIEVLNTALNGIQRVMKIPERLRFRGPGCVIRKPLKS